MEKNNGKEANKPILPIGAVAKILCVHHRTLRIYDEQGLLVPQRSGFNRRLYSLNDVDKGRLILTLTRNFAINLAGVKIILAIIEKAKIKPELYQKYIQEIANSINLGEELQEFNIKRLSKRGKRINSD